MVSVFVCRQLMDVAYCQHVAERDASLSQYQASTTANNHYLDRSQYRKQELHESSCFFFFFSAHRILVAAAFLDQKKINGDFFKNKKDDFLGGQEN